MVDRKTQRLRSTARISCSHRLTRSHDDGQKRAVSRRRLQRQFHRLIETTGVQHFSWRSFRIEEANDGVLCERQMSRSSAKCVEHRERVAIAGELRRDLQDSRHSLFLGFQPVGPHRED
jgi:hypothetical protein